MARKDTELQRADQVIVASRFTERTLQLAPHSVPVVTVIPYGAPAAVSGALPHHRAGKLRVLFVGALGQRKGLSYLVTAVERMSAAVELTLLGVKTSATCAPLNEAVRRHPWIPSLPHAEVLAEMGRHDLLVFPSLFEGFGLVILEALSQGIPVITTPHTGGPDVITEGVDGFIVPIRSSLAIAEKLELLARDHPLLCDMKEAARATARRLSWENYRSRLVAAVTPLVTREIGLVPQPLTEAR